MRIYTLLGDSRRTARCAALQGTGGTSRRDALTRYRARDWAGRSRAALGQCYAARDPRLEGLYDLYDERLAYYAANPPEADWDGVFVALTK